MQHFWPTIQNHIKAQVDERTWNLFFRHLTVSHWEGHQILFELPDEFFVTWFENNYKDYLIEVIQQATGQRPAIRLYARGAIPTASDPVSVATNIPQLQSSGSQAHQPQGAMMGGSSGGGYQPGAMFQSAQASAYGAPQGFSPHSPHAPAPPRPLDPMADQAHGAGPGGEAARAYPTQLSLNERILRAGLNPRYTFDHFVVGPSNQFCNAACLAVGDRPAVVYNPLFLYGGVGLGKTHLLHAVGIEILKQNPDKRVTYVTSENFMNGLIHSLRNKDTNAFRTRYRDEVDVLLMDDIQFIAGKSSTQEEFFHTFNALHQAHKQIVITSDKMPQELPALEERLRSRFAWGLIADVQPPEIETRIAIIRKKAEAEQIHLDDDVAMFLATHIRSNVRELEGSLIKLKASASLFKKPVTMDFAKEQLRGLIQERNQHITIERIQKLVSNFYNVKVKDLLGKRRHRVIAHPRHIAMFLSRKHTKHSFPEIGKSFGGRDHSTVMNAVRKIEDLVESDDAVRGEIKALEGSILC